MWITFCQEIRGGQTISSFAIIAAGMKKGPTKTKKTKAQRKHGFLARMASFGGRKVLKRRRAEGRKALAI